MSARLKPSGAGAVMASRKEAPSSLDYFPSPPWATRALLEYLAPLDGAIAWEPAAGAGHMSDVLAEYFFVVHASDVHDYGRGHRIGSFVGQGPDVIETPDPRPDWIITNPPFNLAVEFAERAIDEAADGVALLVRTAWLESVDRHKRVFGKVPPTTVIQFSERVPMCKGRWDPNGGTATAYCWVVWVRGVTDTRMRWFPPGTRDRCWRDRDIREFAGR